VDKHWTAERLPDLHGRTAVVTGATGGIGGSVARELARAGALVVIAARDSARGEARAQEIRAAVPAAQVEVRRLDLASLAAVRAFAEGYAGAHEGPDLLINCAGVMAVPEQRTEDGFELQFGVNHLAHFALTGLLLPTMKNRVGARVVTVSSLNHQWGRIDWDDPQQTRRYKAWRGYNQSKLANLLFAFELDRRLRAAGAAAESLAAHPGYTDTGLQGRVGGAAVRVVLQVTNRLFGQAPDMGALPVLYAAAAPGVPGGSYIGPRRFGETRGHPALARASAAARDPALAARLWALSEELTGVSFPV
jgi:NAD(P)-dependent dehydrogenase (short-subunit alcohol dehydrogenase family)